MLNKKDPYNISKSSDAFIAVKYCKTDEVNTQFQNRTEAHNGKTANDVDVVFKSLKERQVVSF